MPRCIAPILSTSGTSTQCSFAGLVDPSTGCHLCREHEDRCRVTIDEVVELLQSALQASSCPTAAWVIDDGPDVAQPLQPLQPPQLYEAAMLGYGEELPQLY